MKETIFDTGALPDGIYIYCDTCGGMQEALFMDIGSTWCDGVHCGNFPTMPVCVIDRSMRGYCEKCHGFTTVTGHKETKMARDGKRTVEKSMLLCEKCKEGE